MEAAVEFTPDDLAYIEENFVSLEVRPEFGPRASYVLDDGTEFYPHDYFSQEMNEARFRARLHAEMHAQKVTLDPDETWEEYLTGIYGVCLQSVTPENIVRKAALLQRIGALTAAPDPQNATWIADLKRAVDALDALERPFSPHYDRIRFGRPPTRDTYIRDVRRRYPQIV